jgi:dTDP-glucose pyrophosphorylase
MKIIITMAGKGQRFRDAGYDMPKYMIDALGKSLFEWSMLSLQEFFSFPFVFIVREEDKANEFISKKCDQIGIKNFTIMPLPAITDGQATTVLSAAGFIDPVDSFAVYNIDTYIVEGELRPGDLKGEGFIPGFRAEGSKWSFISMDETNKVTDIAEKVPISDIATLGFYYFESFALYKEFYEKAFKDGANLVNGEKYIAPVYKELVDANRPVFGSIIPAQKVWGLGTPDDLIFFLNNYEQQ